MKSGPWWKLSPKRRHQAMYGMIYPGVLGSFLMMFADKWFQDAFSLSQPVPWLCGFMFVALFTLDYVYSLGKDIENNYRGSELFWDAIIVVLIYLAGHSIFNAATGVTPAIWGYLFAAKFVSLVWEHSPFAAVPPRGGISDTLPCIGFAVGWIFCGLEIASQTVQIVLFLVVIAIDGALYLANTSDA